MLSSGGALHASNYKKSGVRCPLLRLRLRKGKLIVRLPFMVYLRFSHESVRPPCTGAAAKGLRFGMAWRWRRFVLRNGSFACHKDKAFKVCAAFP